MIISDESIKTILRRKAGFFLKYITKRSVYNVKNHIKHENNFLLLAYTRKKGIEEIEKNYLMDLLNETMGRIKQAAEIAGITTRQLHKLMTRYNLHKEDYKAHR